MFGLMGLIGWLKDLFSEHGGTSSKRVAFIAVIVSSIVWLSTDLHHHGLTDLWIAAFNSLLIAAGGSYVAGRMTESYEKIKGVSEPDPTPKDDAPTDSDDKPDDPDTKEDK
jgi:hypothetical protein